MIELEIPPSERIRTHLLKMVRHATTPGRTFSYYRRASAPLWSDLVRHLAADPSFHVSGRVAGASDISALLTPALRERNLWGSPARAWIKDLVRLSGTMREVLGHDCIHMAIGAGTANPEWTDETDSRAFQIVSPYCGKGVEVLLRSEGPLRRILHCPAAWVIALNGVSHRVCPSQTGSEHLVLVLRAVRPSDSGQ